jgi:osmotically-inducible protein OsmY
MSTNTDRNKAEVFIDDSAITTKIKAKYAADDLVNATDVHVKTNDSIVTLTGTVPNEMAWRQAEEIAKKTSGVKEVKNEIKVVH